MKVVEKIPEYKVLDDIPYGEVFKFRDNFYMKIVSDDSEDSVVINIYTTKQAHFHPNLLVEIVEGAFVEGYVDNNENDLPFCAEE